ncbi:MAG TPA: hypothetical protein PLV59_03340 [Candidatus Dojkabacteria bacterium]|nr:hypothetical protein [Candidatus Dojkabacteria bacterium]
MKIKYLISKDRRVQAFNKLIKDNFPEFINEKNPEAILVAGGDGAMLHAIQDWQELNIPFIGKALGTVNFMMNNINNDIDFLSKLKRGDVKIKYLKTNSIRVEVNKKYITEAVNEILIGGDINSYNTFNLNTEDGSFNSVTIKGAGLCISTPLGSTAYNFNNQGAILPLQTNIWSLTGIVSNKYINDIISAQNIELTAPNSLLYADGIKLKALKDDDTVQISKGKEVRLGFLDKDSLFRKRIEVASRLRRG